MRLLAVLLVTVLVACTGAKDEPATTVEAAEPRPAPTMTETMSMEPVISTAGSPAPSALAPGSQFVTLAENGISMRSELPRAHTVFLVANETEAQHDLVLRAAASEIARVQVPRRGTAVLQATIAEPGYELTCVTPGHSETAAFTTYVPGSPLKVPGPG